ncbi:MAG: hypothetical protein KC643_19420 [Nitrospira sp.]|nr:hypothetical protein [Nitrospira sp.]
MKQLEHDQPWQWTLDNGWGGFHLKRQDGLILAHIYPTIQGEESSAGYIVDGRFFGKGWGEHPLDEHVTRDRALEIAEAHGRAYLEAERRAYAELDEFTPHPPLCPPFNEAARGPTEASNETPQAALKLAVPSQPPRDHDQIPFHPMPEMGPEL